MRRQVLQRLIHEQVGMRHLRYRAVVRDAPCRTGLICHHHRTLTHDAHTCRYANDLGLRATIGFQQYQRQDLIGGRYGLMGIPHDNEKLGAGLGY